MGYLFRLPVPAKNLLISSAGFAVNAELKMQENAEEIM